jgi:large subunit ribosomal protein L39
VLTSDISETKCKTSVVALVDNKQLWDMHRPLEGSCTLQLLNFRMTDPSAVNRVFWRSCSFLLGAVMQRTFKETSELFLHSFPRPNVKSGSFVHDISLKESNWKPSESDFNTLKVEMIKLASEALKIERLDVSHEIAMEMFSDNPFKREQLPNISNQSNGVVTLYRAGDHIDISRGPMMANTSFIGTSKIAAAHKISNPGDPHNLYRVQGVALPAGFTLSAFAFDILADRASKLVSSLEATTHLIITEEFHRTQKRCCLTKKSRTITTRPSCSKALTRNLETSNCNQFFYLRKN